MYRFIRLAVASIALATPLTAQARLSVTGLLTEYRANPLGTDIAKPRLSWRIESAQRNTMQAAYQIQVASSAAAVKGAVASARVYVTARGLYELHLNGQRIGDDFFTPG